MIIQKLFSLHFRMLVGWLLVNIVSNSAQATNYYSISSNNWTSSSTWSLTSGGAAISSGYPGSGDNVIIEGGYTVTISGTSTLSAANVNIGSTTNGTLLSTASSGATLTISGDLTVGGSTGTGAINYNNWGLWITCNKIIKGSGAISRLNALQQDFTFTGTFTLPAEFNEFRNFVVGAGGYVTLSANIETNGSISPAIDLGGTLDMQSYLIDIGGWKNFNINGTLILGGNSGGVGNSNFPSNFENLVIGSSSTVNYSYSGAQSIYPGTYNNLILSGSGAKTVTGIVSGLVINSAGSNYFCGASLNFSGGGGSGASGTASEDWDTPYGITSVTLTSGGSGYTSVPTVSVSGDCGGSGANVTASILTNLAVNNSLSISSGVTFTVNSTLTCNGSSHSLDGSLIIGSNGTLNIASGTFQTNNNLTLAASASGHARVASLGGTISGNCNVQFYIPANKRAYRLIGNPFSTAVALSSLIDDVHITGVGGASNGFDATTNNSPSAFSFTESTYFGTSNSGWNAFTNASHTIAASGALRIFYRGPRTQSNLLDGSNPSPQACVLDWTGPINQGTQNIAMSYTGANGGNAGWNLIPNPYTSNVNIGNIGSGNRNGINSFSVWVPTNGTRGAYVTNSFGSSYIIPPYSAFFVQTGSAANFTFLESDKTSSSASVSLLKSESLKQNALQINVVSDDTIFWDQFVIKNRENALNAIDNWDARKMENPDVNFSSIINTDDKLAIDYRNLGEEHQVDLLFNTSSPYHFSFKVDYIDLPQYTVVLKDYYLKSEINLNSNSVYNFVTNADAQSFGKNRFKLLFKKATTGDDENSSFSGKVTLYPNPAGNHIFLNLYADKMDIYKFQILNELGQVVDSGSINFEANQALSWDISKLNMGIYFMKLEGQNSNQIIRFIKINSN